MRRLVLATLCVLIAILSVSFLRGSTALRSLTTYFPQVARFSTSPIVANIRSPVPNGADRLSTPNMTTKTYTPREEKEFGRLGDTMQQFHNHFRHEFNRIYELADGGFHKEGMTLARFLRQSQQLSHHLDMHHMIEETYIFPILGKRMPQFKDGARESGEHLKSHRAIHAGLDKYDAFVKEALENTSSYNPATLRAIMDGFKEVLFRHLDEEVQDLQADSMKAAGWSLQEIRQLPM